MVVQSEDTPPGRPCEQCVASSLSGGVEHSAPYIWDNSNYLLKMTDDLDFLRAVDPLVRWLGEGFELRDNPFLLAPADTGEGQRADKERGRRKARRSGTNPDLEGTTGDRAPVLSAPLPRDIGFSGRGVLLRRDLAGVAR